MLPTSGRFTVPIPGEDDTVAELIAELLDYWAHRHRRPISHDPKLLDLALRLGDELVRVDAQLTEFKTVVSELAERRHRAGKTGGEGNAKLKAAQQQTIRTMVEDLRRKVPYCRYGKGSTRWMSREIAKRMGLDAEVVRRYLKAEGLQ
jgi:hypothetical protein